MKMRLSLFSMLLIGLSMAGLLGGMRTANAAAAGQSIAGLAADHSVNPGIIQVDRHYYRGRHYYRRHGYGPFFSFSFGPGYYGSYYDYPSYGYSDGYGRCGYWRGRCADRWGFRSYNFYGCLRYHECY